MTRMIALDLDKPPFALSILMHTVLGPNREPTLLDPGGFCVIDCYKSEFEVRE
jgi:hypothetical protein